MSNITKPLKLLAVRLVLRQFQRVSIPDVVDSLVSDFLVSDLSLECAVVLSREGSTDLLQLVWDRSERAQGGWSVAKLLRSEPLYRQWAFNLSLLEAVKRSDAKKIKWVLNHFPELPVTQQLLKEAAKQGLLWLLEELECDAVRGGINWAGMAMEGAHDEPPVASVSERLGLTHLPGDEFEAYQAVASGDVAGFEGYLPPPREFTRIIEFKTAVRPMPTRLECPGVNDTTDNESLWFTRIVLGEGYRGMNYDRSDDNVFTLAAGAAHWDVVHWLDEHISTPESRQKNRDLIPLACAQNNLDQLKWLVKKGFYMYVKATPRCAPQEWRLRSQVLRYLIDTAHASSLSDVWVELHQCSVFRRLL